MFVVNSTGLTPAIFRAERDGHPARHNATGLPSSVCKAMFSAEGWIDLELSGDGISLLKAETIEG